MVSSLSGDEFRSVPPRRYSAAAEPGNIRPPVLKRGTEALLQNTASLLICRGFLKQMSADRSRALPNVHQGSGNYLLFPPGNYLLFPQGPIPFPEDSRHAF